MRTSNLYAAGGFALIVLALVFELPKAPTAANIARVVCILVAVACFIVYHKLSRYEELEESEEQALDEETHVLYVPIEEDDDFYKLAEAAIAEQRLRSFRAMIEKTDFSIVFLKEERDKRTSERAGGESA